MCEPALESEVNGMHPLDRRLLAIKLERWAHQLKVTAAVIEAQDKALPPPKRIRKIRPELAVKN